MSPLSTWPGFLLFAAIPAAFGVAFFISTIRRRKMRWAAWFLAGILTGVLGTGLSVGLTVLASLIFMVVALLAGRSTK
jgi:hypothetical protein